jgi:fatty-acyl-CoA synthase
MARPRCAPSSRSGPRSTSARRTERNGRQGVRYTCQEGKTVFDPETMLPVPADGETMGEIMFRGNITMKGYLKNPRQRTRRSQAAGSIRAISP